MVHKVELLGPYQYNADHALIEVLQKLYRIGFTALSPIELLDPIEEDKEIFGGYITSSIHKDSLEIVINEDYCWRKSGCDEQAFRRELRVTIAHEIGHAIAELIECATGPLDESLNWQGVFPEEEDFVETFAQCLEEEDIMEYPFWQLFIPPAIELMAEHMRMREYALS